MKNTIENKAELTVEYLAPYMPYGLMCQTTDMGKVVISELNAIYSDNSYTFMNIVESEKGFEDIKPILRPLSDLTKEIEHNEERFVPMEKIFFDKWIDWDGESDCLVSMRNTYNASKGKVHSEFLPGWVLKNLYRWHFDIFGLIEKGLAVDRNTLN